MSVSLNELLLIFILYVDTLLSINQVAQLFESCYDTIHTELRERETAFECGFPPRLGGIQHTVVHKAS